jgi:hypothetical protein
MFCHPSIEGLKQGAKMAFDLSQYELVEDRIRAFWEKYPNGRLLTDVKFHTRDNGAIVWTCHSLLFIDKEDTRPTTTGFAMEVEGSTNVNKYSAAENCETSSLGRCLANFLFAAKGKRASESEMKKVKRMTEDEKIPKVYEDAKPFFDALELSDTMETLEGIRNKITGNRAKLAPADLDALRNMYEARKVAIEATL